MLKSRVWVVDSVWNDRVPAQVSIRTSSWNKFHQERRKERFFFIEQKKNELFLRREINYNFCFVSFLIRQKLKKIFYKVNL